MSNPKSNLMLTADRTKPNTCRNFSQRWIKASQMINCRTGLTAQQISKSVLHSHINYTYTYKHIIHYIEKHHVINNAQFRYNLT